MKLIMTSGFFVRFATIFNRGAVFVASAVVYLSIQGAYASDPQSGEIATSMSVGEVSLVLGKAYIETPDQARQLVRVGTSVKVNDRVSTEANGHVHIRFIDQALISVRPDSRLEIVRYDYDARQPDQSTIKFNLVEGVTRSISGKAAKSARERFRLNTPIAAIGVRGTDFVVSANQQTVRALVNEGIIVMAPFSDECTAASFGPCATNAVELTGESLQILELNIAAPTMLPASHERDPGMMREELQLVLENGQRGNENGEDKNVANDAYLESVSSLKVTAEVVEAARIAESSSVDPIPPPNFVPESPLDSNVLTARQLTWGRWAVGRGDQERITLAYADAVVDRAVTIGNNEYALFRIEENGSKRLERGLGPVSFSLNSAQAYYHSDSGVVAMQVGGGTLDIDFDQNRFATELNLSHNATGPVDFFATGRVFSGGYFYNRAESQNIAGAVSLDGSEAGYFFDKQLETGGIQGLTLWDSQ